MASRLWTVWLLMPVVLCGSIATWNADADLARQIMMSYQSKIYYSLCNSTGAPVFPFDDTTTLELPFPIMGGTKITGTGYKTNGSLEASVFYQESGGQIIQAIYECNSTGYFELSPHRSRRISLGIADSILEATGMQVFLSEPDEGLRLFYKDKDHRISIMSCPPGAEDWFPSEYASQLEQPGSAIGGAVLDPGVPVVVSPFDSQNETSGIQICMEDAQAHEWRIDAFPGQMQISNAHGSLKGPTNFSLPSDNWTWTGSGDGLELDSFDANLVDLTLSFGSTGGSNVFYIGKDKGLHHYQLTKDGTWAKAPVQDETTWPIADSSFGSVGIDFDATGDMVWLYYMNGGSLIQVSQTGDGTWDTPARLPTQAPFIPPPPSSPTTDGPVPSTGSVPPGESPPDIGLAKRFAIGICTFAGLIALVLLSVNVYNSMRDSKIEEDKRLEAEIRSIEANKPPEAATPASSTSTSVSSQQVSGATFEPGYWAADGSTWVSLKRQP
ncbi:hypothetical protein LQW54_002710 [Pestalotiopsis sp. IQ-011]